MCGGGCPPRCNHKQSQRQTLGSTPHKRKPDRVLLAVCFFDSMRVGVLYLIRRVLVVYIALFTYIAVIIMSLGCFGCIRASQARIMPLDAVCLRSFLISPQGFFLGWYFTTTHTRSSKHTCMYGRSSCFFFLHYDR